MWDLGLGVCGFVCRAVDSRLRVQVLGFWGAGLGLRP